MTPEITDYDCNKRNLNDRSEGAETINKSNLFQILIVFGTNEYIYELVREKGTHKVSGMNAKSIFTRRAL